MPATLSVAQQSALARESQEVLFAIKIDLTSDLLYCSGLRQVTIDATTYTPRGVQVSTVNVGDPTSSRATVTLDDLDGTIAAVWYTERFSGQTVTITEAIYDDGAWTAVRTIPWICTTCNRHSDGRFVINLSGAGGLKPRAGLGVASRADWSMAPEPGTSIQVGWTVTTVE